MHIELALDQHPRLKSGVLIIPDFSDLSKKLPDSNPAENQSFYIGTILGGLIFPTSELLPILRIIQEGQISKSIQQLADVANVLVSELVILLQELAHAGLLILDPPGPATTQKKRNQLNQSQHYLHERLEPERALASWRTNQSKSLDETFLDRSEFTILIFGSNRVAITLLSLLYASGFTQIKLVEGHRQVLTDKVKDSFAKTITPSDVCGLFTRISDIGSAKPDFLLSIARNTNFVSQSSQPRKKFPEIPNLIISTEVAQPDYIQRWMSEGVTHLQVSQLSPSVIEIGPMITPGSGPCLRCINLNNFGNDRILNKIQMISHLEVTAEFPSSATALISGLLSLFIAEFVDTKSTSLTAHSIRINLFDPGNPEHIYWEPHPHCGCN